MARAEVAWIASFRNPQQMCSKS